MKGLFKKKPSHSETINTELKSLKEFETTNKYVQELVKDRIAERKLVWNK